MIENRCGINKARERKIYKNFEQQRKKILVFFSISTNSNLPTTCMSPDTSIVLKCGASAETVCENDEIFMKIFHGFVIFFRESNDNI